MTIQRMPGSAITPGTITVTQLESSVANVINTGGGPKITAITVTNNAYTNLDDTAVSVAGGYIKITGTGFVTGCSIIIGSLVATSVSFISATEVRAQIPAQSAGTYTVYLVNPDGGVGIRVNGVNYSSMPSWTTTSPLPGGLVDSAISIQLAATSNSTVTYALQAGSTLPTGLTLSSAGLLSGTVTGITVDTTYNFTIVATDAELQDTPQAFAITITAVALDAYYNLVSLHLKGDVATGGNLTVFSDASTNNFQLTTNGDVRGAAFSPYNTSWSVYFDGTGDNLSSSSGFVLAGDFTVECWMYRISSASGSVIISIGAEGTGRIYFYVNSSNVITYGIHNVGEYSLGNMAILNSWVHIAITRVSSTITAYVNGVATGTTGTTSGSVGNSTAFYIGSTGVPNNHHYGYISNLRVVNGTAIYTANFTPSTSPLTAVTNTAVLTCNSNRFRDSSTNNFTITRNGDTRIASFSPFLETDTTTGSGYFDGTGDYLLTPNNAAFQLGTGEFTIETWFYKTVATGGDVFSSKAAAGNDSTSIGVYVDSTSIYVWNNGAQITASSPPLNTWNHIAITRNSSNVLTLWLNGASVGTLASFTANLSKDIFGIGALTGGGETFFGYISNLRILKGVAVYTGNFTPPTAPLTVTQSAGTNIQAITGTQTALLTLQERGAYNTIGFQDESEYQHIITRYGNAAQGTFSPFSPAGWGNYFGTSGHALGVSNGLIQTTDTTFTMECWVYMLSNPTGGNPNTFPVLIGQMDQTAGEIRLALGPDGNGKLNFYWYDGSNKNVISTTTIQLNTWTHIAVSVNSNAITLYINGTSSGTGTLTNRNSLRNTFYIGNHYTTVYNYVGYVSQVRVVSGVAVYTGNFTPPTSLLMATQSSGTNISAITTGQTKLLTCQSNRFVDNGQGNTSNTPFAITIAGSPTVAAFSPFAPVAYDPAVHGGSGYFDGNLDYITSTNATAFVQGTGNFTAECWVYPVANGTTGSYGRPMIFGTVAGSQAGWSVLWEQPPYGAQSGLSTLGTESGGWGGTLTSAAGVAPIGAWTHVALVRNGANLTLYANGVSVATRSDAGSYNFPNGLNNEFRLGYFSDGSSTGSFNGYISNFRLVKGTAVYTGNFTPPSSPLPLLGNTSLLLNFTNAGIIDSTGKNVIETVGNAGVVTAVKKYGTGSIYFDGTGDYLTLPSNNLVSFGTADFTVEFWVNYASATAYTTVIISTWFIEFSNTRGLVFYDGATGYIRSYTVATSQWYYIAVSKQGTNLRLFVDGVQQGATITSFTYNITNASTLEVGRGQGGSYPVNGYIDDLRITRGYARYTANFTAPTKAFADQGQASTAVSALAAPTSVDYLVVAGGGGGASGNGGGGGGAGGFRTDTGLSVTAGTYYTITIGSGGAGGASGIQNIGVSGSDSVFGTITATKGGGGGCAIAPNQNGLNGGSGGGGGGSSPTNGVGGTGNTPSTSPSQGSSGGTGVFGGYPVGAGGGGASAVGVNATTSAAGNGGAGQSSSISGVSTTYGGGGGGAPDFRQTGTAGTGGSGGGGNGSSSATGSSGTINTGGGGGGGGFTTGPNTFFAGGSGGSGIVIIAYPTTFKPLTATLGLTYTVDTQTRSGYRVYRFLGGTGSISW